MQFLKMVQSKTGKHLASIILFPLMFFLLLSCPTKRELKLMLNIPVQTISAGNCNNAQASCYFEQNSTAKEQIEPQSRHLSGLMLAVPHTSLQLETSPSVQVWRNTDAFIRTSLFLCYRKLII